MKLALHAHIYIFYLSDSFLNFLLNDQHSYCTYPLRLASRLFSQLYEQLKTIAALTPYDFYWLRLVCNLIIINFVCINESFFDTNMH